jgi:hypothetical protein
MILCVGVCKGRVPYSCGVLRARRLAEGAAAPSGQEKRIFRLKREAFFLCLYNSALSW